MGSAFQSELAQYSIFTFVLTAFKRYCLNASNMLKKGPISDL